MKVLDSKSFGEMIKAQRKKLGYTQKYICEVSGISASFISDLENGKGTVQLQKLLAVISALGLSMFVYSAWSDK